MPEAPSRSIPADAFQQAVTALQAGRTEAAIDLLRRSLGANPDQAYVHSTLAAVLLGAKRFDEALVCCDALLRLAPDQAQSHYNRGLVLMELKRAAESLASFDRALQIKPDYVQALHNRAVLLGKCGRPAEALEGYDRVLRIRADLPETLNNRGAALLDLQRFAEALASLDAALRLRPEFADALHNRGNALRGLLRFAEASASFATAIQLGERRAHVLANYGWTLLESQRYEDAAETFAGVLAVEPGSKYVLGALLLARVMCCDWANYQQSVYQLIASVNEDECATSPFILMAAADAPELHGQCSRAYTTDRFQTSDHPAWRGRRYEHERIRLAYVSGDFRDHVVTRLLAPLIERHDRERFEVIGISVRPPEDSPIGQRIRTAFDRFHDVSRLRDDRVASLLCELEVDIAVDLGGFTGSQRSGIFAHRGAPVQVSYLGYPGTLGAQYIQYLLADPVLIPESERSHYSENIVYLPECYQVNHTERPLPDVLPTRRECGLPEQGLVLCCFNNSFKLNPPVFDVWMRLLSQLPNSVLWLAGHRPSVVQNLRAAAQERRIAPERLIFAEHRHRHEDHLVRYALADLFLDTFPFGAHATASDALWYGAPVVTCMGRSFASRVAGSLLHAVGLPDLITHDLPGYEAKVLELARDPPRLAQMRQHLSSNRTTHALFDTDRFRRHLESAYRTMWERQRHGEPPAGFAVPRESGLERHQPAERGV